VAGSDASVPGAANVAVVMHEAQIGPPVAVDVGNPDVGRLEGGDVWDDGSNRVELEKQ
jgi:hypothetical protein